MKKRTGTFTIIAAASSIALYSVPLENVEKVTLSMSQKQVSEIPAKVVEIIDGDTIKVFVNGKLETVRYLLVDTPESKSPKTCVQFYAKEAFLRNSELIKSGKVTLEFEQGNPRDSYGRLLAYIYVDGVSIQGTLLKEGYARVAYVMNPPYKYLEFFRDEENQAKSAKINIWSKFGFVSDWGFNGCKK